MSEQHFTPTDYLHPFQPPSQVRPARIRCTEDRPGEGLGIQAPAGIYGVGKARYMASHLAFGQVDVPVHIASARHAQRLREAHYEPNMHERCAAYLGGTSILGAIATRPEEVFALAVAYMPHLERRHFDDLPEIAAAMLAKGHILTPEEADPHLLEGTMWEHSDGSEEFLPPVMRVPLEADDHAAPGVVAIYSPDLWDTAAAWQNGTPRYGLNPGLLPRVNHALNSDAGSIAYHDGLQIPENQFMAAHAALVGATIMHLPQPEGIPLDIQLIGY